MYMWALCNTFWASLRGCLSKTRQGSSSTMPRSACGLLHASGVLICSTASAAFCKSCSSALLCIAVASWLSSSLGISVLSLRAAVLFPDLLRAGTGSTGSKSSGSESYVSDSYVAIAAVAKWAAARRKRSTCLRAFSESLLELCSDTSVSAEEVLLPCRSPQHYHLSCVSDRLA